MFRNVLLAVTLVWMAGTAVNYNNHVKEFVGKDNREATTPEKIAAGISAALWPSETEFFSQVGLPNLSQYMNSDTAFAVYACYAYWAILPMMRRWLTPEMAAKLNGKKFPPLPLTVCGIWATAPASMPLLWAWDRATSHLTVPKA